MAGTKVLIRADALIDGSGEGPKRDHGVLIDGDRIAAVGPVSSLKTDGAEIIDLKDATILPGLMDLHVHLMAQNLMSYTNYRATTFEVTPQAQMLHAILHAQITMEMGFTTLRDVGWFGYTGNLIKELVAIRDAFGQRLLPGPRMYVAAMSTVTGSHLEMIMPPAAVRPEGTTADGPWELRKLVRVNIRAGADWIKTNASGGTSGFQSVVNVNNAMTQEELDAIVSEAHTFGKRVAIHSFTAESQKMALKAGADTLEHSVFTDDEAIKMMLERGTTLVPTLVKRCDETMALGTKSGRLPLFTTRMKSVQATARESFKKLHKAGVKLALGTDTTVEPLAGQNAQELCEYVTYGMTPIEALQTATKNAAEALGHGKDLGTLEPGKIADVIAVRGDPTTDIALFKERQNIQLVVKAGRVYLDRRPGHERSIIQDREWDWAQTQ
jgi:imidazolonepropionase-like amidohydrolase